MFARKKKRKVIVGLSGGVDSAVSAALLQKEGYDVEGVFIRIALPGYPCQAGADRQDALRAAAHLGIPFRNIDLSKEYKARVFAQAIKAYARGETPNPDALCNREIKFGLFYDYAMSKGAQFVATGHYARTQQPAGKETHLLAGVDPNKDQSYFLWAVPEERLAKTIFPVGEMKKTQVRALAQRLGLPNASRKDSQGLCFLGPVSMEEMLRKELRPSPGAIINEHGAIVGDHRGAALYTIGERHGFTLRAGAGNGQPHYVIAKDMENNTITVSDRQRPSAASMESAVADGIASNLENEQTRITLREENWIGNVEPGPCEARFRYRQELIPAVLNRNAGASIVQLQEPQYVPVGQSLVLYRRERCLGGGIIGDVTSA